MANFETIFDDSAFLTETASILPDNNTGDISAQDMRDFFVTIRDRNKVKSLFYSSTASLTVDLSAATVQHIVLTQNQSSVTFVNAPPFNLLYRSEDITNSPWELLASTTVSAANVTGAFGTSTADRYTIAAVANTRLSQQINAIAGAQYRFQFYAKSASGATVNFDYGFADGAVTTLTLKDVDASVSATWTFFETVYTAATTATIWADIDNRQNTTAVDLYLDRLQVCEGRAKSDYVKTNPFPAGEIAQVQLYLQQDNTGSRTVSWGSRVFWENSATPTLSTTANTVDSITLVSTDGGQRWRGTYNGQGWGG